MILNISISNFRSFKDETSFSMIAESSKSKAQNVFIQPLAEGNGNERLLKVALIYGANASGKSNFLRAIFDIRNFVCGKIKPKAGEPIPAYDSFCFAEETKDAPIDFLIEFAGKDQIKYKYELTFDRDRVIKESLEYFPKNSPKSLFKRFVPENTNSNTHIARLGAEMKNKEIEVLYNQTILSRFGDDTPNQIITDVFIYLLNFEVINIHNSRVISALIKEVNTEVSKNIDLNRRIDELLKFADTGLNGVRINEISEDKLSFPDTMPDSLKSQLISEYKYDVSFLHNHFENGLLVKSDKPHKIGQESKGTQTIYALGGKLFQILNSGGVIFVDELETSLHPYLSKLLVSMIQSERINPNNAQLIFTTHDTNLLDQTMFRKDQIWFTEKNEFGATELYSLQDFSDVREDTPYAKWYMAGKFGGIPNIQSIESLFSEE
jgi:AAA15 family ATPase/GTPase